MREFNFAFIFLSLLARLGLDGSARRSRQFTDEERPGSKEQNGG